MPLTHVAMWTNHGWQDITAENASAHSKVSAHSGLFMCKICKQYVTLKCYTERAVDKHPKIW